MKVPALFIYFVVLCHARKHHKANGRRRNNNEDRATLESLKQVTIPLAEQCSKQLNAPFSEWQYIFYNLVTNKDVAMPQACLIACMGKKMYILNADGTFNREGAFNALQKIDSLYDYNHQLREETKQCLNQVTEGRDECETASIVVKCVKVPNIHNTNFPPGVIQSSHYR